MASASKKPKGLYNRNDLVDKFLFSKLFNNIRHDKLALMARDLGLPDREFASSVFTREMKIEKVGYIFPDACWHCSCNLINICTFSGLLQTPKL